MKKLILLLCPVALVALGTSARAGSYLPVSPNAGNLDTFYAGSVSVPGVSAFIPRAGTYSDYPPGNSNDTGLSRKTWVWRPTPGLNDPAPSQKVSCSYTFNGNVFADATPDVYDALGAANFKISGSVSAQFGYSQQVRYGYKSSNTFPTGGPTSQWTPYGTDRYANTVYPFPYAGQGGGSSIRAEASATVSNSAGVVGPGAPARGQASSGQASIGITDFDCPNQPH